MDGPLACTSGSWPASSRRSDDDPLMMNRSIKLCFLLSACTATQLLAQTSSRSADSLRKWWWPPGDDRPLPAYVEYENDFGRLGILNADGPVETDGHPFFEPLGTNGRACVSCHQPADAMSLSVASITQIWQATNGTDPIFAPVDGMNCPNLPPGDPASHSLLLERGLFRIARPWPPGDTGGRAVEPECTIEVVRDPTSCNTDPVYGIDGERGEVSVYRRPRPAANLRYVASSGF